MRAHEKLNPDQFCEVVDEQMVLVGEMADLLYLISEVPGDPEIPSAVAVARIADAFRCLFAEREAGEQPGDPGPAA
jgi:hypothetical protein